MSLAFSCADADRFLGFGAQADGIDHHGHTVAMWTSEPGIGKQMTDDEYPDLWFLVGTRHASSFGLPTWVSNRGYQGLVGSDARSVFEVCSKHSDVFRIEVWSNKFTLWLYEGAPATAVSRATRTVLGRPMRPPPMAFAPWNDAVFGPAEVRRVAALLRDNHIPSSAIWTEDFRGGTDEPSGYRLVEEWDTRSNSLPGSRRPRGRAAGRRLRMAGVLQHLRGGRHAHQRRGEGRRAPGGQPRRRRVPVQRRHLQTDGAGRSLAARDARVGEGLPAQGARRRLHRVDGGLRRVAAPRRGAGERRGPAPGAQPLRARVGAAEPGGDGRARRRWPPADLLRARGVAGQQLRHPGGLGRRSTHQLPEGRRPAHRHPHGHQPRARRA